MSLLVSDAPLDFRIKSNLVADLLTLAGEPIENICTYVYTVLCSTFFKPGTPPVSTFILSAKCVSVCICVSVSTPEAIDN